MISGKIIHGDGIGKKQGYATANIDMEPSKTKLNSGVYAAWVNFGDKKYNAALIVANQPHKVEVHLLDYAGPDFYGKKVSVDPIQKVSEVLPADSVSELRKKIEDDLSRVRAVFKSEQSI